MANVAPVAVSPLIKFTRWSLLLAGVAYGATRQAALSKRENSRRAEEEKTRPEREAKIAAEKRKMNKEQQIELAKAAGVILPADFEG